MTIALGIDTGGTYTDAALVDHQSGEVLAAAKSLTTRRDLSIGIRKAVGAAFADNGHAITPAAVDMVALSTTLATNAIVEGQGSPVCLLLLGYDESLIKARHFERDLVTQNVVYLRGKHNGQGDEVEPLDEDAVREAILAWQGQVEAFAVSGYFSVRNPAHEVRVRALIEEHTRRPDGTSLPVTCGHQLTTRLDSVRRATTVALNARLIPLLQELISTVRQSLQTLGIHAPLMVVKGDGSLVRAEWAIRRPIETILSGPAASVVGAWHLARRGDVWVVDMGGTTTDIAALTDGRPQINRDGARVAGWRTMVEAIDVHTVGLGGDSQVQVNGPASAKNWLEIGPRRVMPLRLLAAQSPQIVTELRQQLNAGDKDKRIGQFVLPNRKPAHQLSDDEAALLAALARGPQSWLQLFAVGKDRRFAMTARIERLRSLRLVLQAGFTPTDALTVLGQMGDAENESETEAAQLGAALLANKAGLTVEAFCRHVVESVSDRVTTELVNKVLGDENAAPDWVREPTAAAMLNRALGNVGASGLDCRLTLKQPVVAIGAPVAAYFPRAAAQLNTELVIPNHAEVANAVGAVAGGVVQRFRVRIKPLDGEGTKFRAHLPDGVRDFDELEVCVSYAEGVVSAYLVEQTRRAGAAQVEVKMQRRDQVAPVASQVGGEIYLGTELDFTALGRPGLAEYLNSG